MSEKETNDIRQNTPKAKPIDAMDRRILSVLSNDATGSYADLAREVGLSAPAVHERVKRLRVAGAIKRTVAQLDGPSVGKNFLAFIHIESAGWGKTKEIIEMADMPEVEEVHAVTGDTGLILKVRMENARAMEGFLWLLYDKAGVHNTRTYVALSTHLERGVQAEITHELAEGDHLK